MHELVTRNYTNLFFFFSLPNLFSACFPIKLYCKTFFLVLLMMTVLFVKYGSFTMEMEWEGPLIWASQGFCKERVKVVVPFPFPTCPFARSMFATWAILLFLIRSQNSNHREFPGGPLVRN